MRKHLYLYLLLIAAVFVQTAAMKYRVPFPDLVLLVVIFTGIFLGRIEGAEVGFFGGLLRGCFSVGTLPADVILFPLVGVGSYVLAKMLYRQNPLAQAFTVAVFYATVVAVHIFYLNAASGNDLSVLSVLAGSWVQMLLTVAVAPAVFMFFRKALRLTE